MRIVYIVNHHPEAYGGKVIVENIKSVFQKKGIQTIIVDNLEGVPIDSFVIPYGTEASMEMIHKGYSTNIAYLADAETLGYINKIKFYAKNLNVFHYDFFYSIYCLIRDYRIESNILHHFKKAVLVSETDINYFKKRSFNDVIYYCMPNGANFCEVEPKTNSEIIRLGILSHWWHPTLVEENSWFIKSYFRKYTKLHHNVKLCLAGRGSFIEQFRDLPNVEIMGEVGDLNDFFSNIDIFVAANPKGCGILNRVLDAFAYKTCVLGYKNAFTGFRYMKESYVEFDDYDSFEKALDELIDNREKREILTMNAYNEIIQNNDWEKNILNFMHFIFEENV